MTAARPAMKRGRPPGRTAMRDRLLVAFYLDGHTMVECGEKFGITTGRAHQIVAEHEKLHGQQLLRHDRGRPRGAAGTWWMP